MTTTPLHSELCRYHYDALDRSITWTQDRQAGLQRFFCKDRLATEIQNAAQRSIFQQDEHVLAQKHRSGDKVDTTLLATDHQRSVLSAVDSTQAHRIAYTPYGHRPLGNGLLSLLGFNGERPDLVTGHYHLGNGYRQFNPVLMRFNSPDVLSPFGKGGVNAYAYCGNDPVNWIDPNGTMKFSLQFLSRGKNISTNKAGSLAEKILAGRHNIVSGSDSYYTFSRNAPEINYGKYSTHGRKKIIQEMERIQKLEINNTIKSKELLYDISSNYKVNDSIIDANTNILKVRYNNTTFAGVKSLSSAKINNLTNEFYTVINSTDRLRDLNENLIAQSKKIRDTFIKQNPNMPDIAKKMLSDKFNYLDN